MVDPTQAIFSVLKLLALNLGVGLLGCGLLWLGGGADEVDVAVQPTVDALLELPLADVLLLGHPLGGVEVGRRKGQEDVVDGDELRTGAALLVVVPHLHKLGATER